MLFSRLLIFSKSFIFEKFFQEYHLSVKQIDSDQARRLSGLIWVQTVCKGHQQTTLGGKELTPQEVAAGLFSL